MITMHRQNCDVFALDGVFDCVGYHFGVANDFIHGVVPYVVRGIVSSPKDQVRLNFVRNEFHHILKSLKRDVADAII